MKPAALFSDHMVLQRDQTVPVWGWATPGDAITVRFGGQQKRATADSAGQWTVSLDPMPACGEPRDLVLESKRDNQEWKITDVLVGDVWLASGQSNMWWRVCDSNNLDVEIAAATHPFIRLFTVPQRAKAEPSLEIETAWQVCSPASSSTFSAVAYYFGRELHRQLVVPVGLIHASWGGTRIEAWTSREALLTDPAGREAVEQYEKGPADPLQRRAWEEFIKDPVAWERSRVPADPGNTGFAQGWATLEFDDGAWGEMKVPSKWQAHGHNYCGVFWFRRVVDVPATWAGKDLVLHLGACDKHDTTYFNNTPVGRMGWEVKDAWCTPRVYRIPGTLVCAGRNVIATRVYSYMTDGGLIGPADTMRLAADNRNGIALTGVWRFKVEHNFGPQPGLQQPLGPGNPNTPHILYDNMIRPVVPCALRGAIWYQGESNAAAPRRYQTLFPLMIHDWRRVFGQPQLPFYFVQLANYTAPQQKPVETGWAELREAQLLTLRVPHTGMAVAIDVGDANDIHPRNKQEVGRRLALAVLGQCGPLYRSHTIEGDAIRVHFDHATGGLKTSDGRAPQTFAIAGADDQFEWAEARVDGETVVVRSDRVRQPVAVRYAWANNPSVNLCNAARLPAAPFRTDVD